VGARVKVGILGPFEVRVDETAPVALGGVRQRAVLAILTVRANQVVSTDRLIDELWGEQARPRAAHTLQVFVSRLRSGLGAGGSRLITRPPGYLFELDADELDAAVFERMITGARTSLAAGLVSEAEARLMQALALWRGAPLADFSYEPFAQATIARLEELHVSGREELIEARLALGRESEVISDLEFLIREQPFRERPRAQLMLALYRSGRQADALEAFQEARRALVEELAIEPGATLRELERAILRQDRALAGPVRAEAVDVTSGLEGGPAVPFIGPIDQGTTVRKTATVLVARVAVSGPADPEAARATVSRAYRRVQQAVSAHGGVHISGVGGEWVWVFGLPDVREDDALRAVRAASEIHTEIRNLLGEASSLTARVGIATGEVVANRPEDVFGDPLDRAIALSSKAADREVLVGDATRRLAPGSVKVEACDEAGVWRLLEVTEPPAVAPGSERPMIGRVKEIELASAVFAQARDHQEPRLLTILGEAGIGKSRVAHELVRRLSNEATILRGRCLSYGEGIALWPLREAVMQAVGGDSADAIRSILNDTGDADSVATVVAAALGAVAAERVVERIPWAFRRLFEALASAGPLVLVLEDVHWAAESLLELIDYLVDWMRAPVMILCLARPELLESTPRWGGGHERVASAVLSPLDDAEAQALLDLRLGRHTLTTAQRRQIVQAAEGNPLFVEQLLQASHESEWWSRDQPIPDTIQILLAARLDRLGPGERAFITRAAVVGREFWLNAVVDLMPIEARPSANQHMHALVRRGLIHPDRSSMPGEEQLRFHHILISDVAYRSASKALRAELHERFAEWLEMHGPQYDEFIGYHFERACRYRQELGDSDEDVARLAVRAADKLRDAGRRAFSRGDTNGSVQLLQTAVELLDAVGKVSADILIELGSALTESGDFPGANAALQRALDHARTSGDERQAARASISLSYWRSRAEPDTRAEDMRAVAEQSIMVFERFGDDDGLSRAWHHIAWADWVQSRLAAMEEALERSMRHAERAGVRNRQSQLLTDSARATVFGPRPVPDGIERCHGLLRQAEGDVATSASIEGMLAILEAMDGRVDAARARWRKCKHQLGENGFGFAVAVAQLFYAFIELVAGDAAAAQPELADACAVFERSGDQGRLSTAAALLSSLLCAQARYEEAQRYSDLSRRTASDDDLVSQVIWRGAHARALINTSDESGLALELVSSAVALAERSDFTTLHAGALIDRAEVLARMSLSTDASRDLERAAELYASKGVRLDLVAARLAGSRVATAS
jgi:DNA-binding SARP family transcriptional activator